MMSTNYVKKKTPHTMPVNWKKEWINWNEKRSFWSTLMCYLFLFSFYICVYVGIYVCVCWYIFLCMLVYVFLYVGMYLCVCVCVCVCWCIFVCVLVYIFVCVGKYLCVCWYIFVCMLISLFLLCYCNSRSIILFFKAWFGSQYCWKFDKIVKT
jgi:nuclear pore complex protein Nup62